MRVIDDVEFYRDLQKAFDTVNFELSLLGKLCNCGIRGIVHEWFRSYLTNRQQFTCVEGAINPIVNPAVVPN
jgi:hypothetical protein